MATVVLLVLFLSWFLVSGNCITASDTDEALNCLDAVDKCRENSNCHSALKALDEKCKVAGGRCSAEMVDLPQCGRMMDDIFQYGFQKTRCTCNNNRRCRRTLEKIYDNPCFASIRHLREQNLFPSRITGDAKSDPTTASLATKRIGANPVTNGHLASDKGPRAEFDNGDADIDENIEQPEPINALNYPGGRGNRKKLPKREDEVAQKDRTNYRLLVIILGVLLGIFLLAAVIFFSWSRVRRSIFYTLGKGASKSAKDETASPSSVETGAASQQ